MADYRNLMIDVDELEEGKFYKVYTDSNATTLLIAKEDEDQLIADVGSLKSTQNAILEDVINLKSFRDTTLQEIQNIRDEQFSIVSDINEIKNSSGNCPTTNPVVVNINSSGCTPINNRANEHYNTLRVNGNRDIKVAELSAHAVMIKYCLFKESEGIKQIEAGRLTMLDSNTLVLDEDRVMQNSLLPVNFSVNKNNDVLNLHLEITTFDTYTLKYKCEIF